MRQRRSTTQPDPPNTNGSGQTNGANGNGYYDGSPYGGFDRVEYETERLARMTSPYELARRRAGLQSLPYIPDSAWGTNRAKYHPRNPDLVYQLRLMGATARRVAEAFGTSEVVIMRWRQNHPDFSDAYQRGGDIADARVAESIYHRAIGYSHPETKHFGSAQHGVVSVETIKHYPPDTEAGKFWLVNRQKQVWKNLNTQEMVDEEGKRLIPPQLIVMPVPTKTE